MDKIKVRNIFAAVSNKSILDLLLQTLDPTTVRFWGTEGTVKYLKSKGFDAQSVVSGFDFDGRVKSLDKTIFARILADRTNKTHLEELKKLYSSSVSEKSNLDSSQDARTINSSSVIASEAKQSKKDRHDSQSESRDDSDGGPIDLVIVDLYPFDKSNFPESMDIGGQALIRAAIKNYMSVALVFDASSLASLVNELSSNDGSTTLKFRKAEAQKAAKFVAERCGREADLFS